MPVCGGWTFRQLVLAIVMVITGSINTLSTKWADRERAPGTADKPHGFDHPFFQAVGMFLGEMMCMVVFLVMYCSGRGVTNRQRDANYCGLGYNPLIFLPASLCDMTGTSLMYIGLNLTYASSFQMLRGAVIIFTALLSVAFLGRTIRAQMWIGIVSVIIGLAIVGVSDIIFNTDKNKDTNGIIAGDLLIIMAQIIVAVQMVYEERVINRFTIHPLEAVGWEGIFGFTLLGLLLIPFFHIDAGAFSELPTHKLEDAIDAFHQLGQNWQILTATLGNIFSIAFFNFAGISVTREISATTRMVLDSVRTIIIWVAALALDWQKFIALQILGFVILIIGMMLYNDIGIQFMRRTILTRVLRRPLPPDEDQERLIPEDNANRRRGNIQEEPQPGPSNAAI
ncbi:Solute carrier family 35 member F6 [Mytilus coruscus]|uniref:Solute carrier family 35 member F6 n=1 Tax=Mytilus coruscus TaxID=42192 RepID=A0A6J8AT43_MYTCO|nr:Solute carrier family 35 member F6 [Mytilus coruscus]